MMQQNLFGFKLERTKEALTARGGLVLMTEFNRGMGLRELANQYLPKPGSNRGYRPSVFVESMVTLLQAGGKSLEDMRELEEESGLMKLMKANCIPDSDTIGDWLRRMGEPSTGGEGLRGLGNLSDALLGRMMKRDDCKEYTLDADATMIEGEKEEAQWTYKKCRGYMPMLGFLYENQLCIYDEFREGNIAPATGQKGFYLECKKRMPEGTRISNYRADSASYQAELINQLEEDNVKYAMTADLDRAVKPAIKEIGEEEWREPVKGCGYKIAETIHCMGQTKKAFRLVVKRELRKQSDLFEGEGYFYHAVATNWDELDALEVLNWHNQRGEAENFNKEIKIGFGMEQMPCGQTHANAVFMRLGVIAYNLFIAFKRLTCPEWIRHTIATFRWKLIHVAGRIVHHAGQTILRLVVSLERLEFFRAIRKATCELCYG